MFNTVGRHIEPILHFEDYNMLVWMIDANMFDWEH